MAQKFTNKTFWLIFALVVNFPPIKEDWSNSQYVLFVHFNAYYKKNVLFYGNPVYSSRFVTVRNSLFHYEFPKFGVGIGFTFANGSRLTRF